MQSRRRKRCVVVILLSLTGNLIIHSQRVSEKEKRAARVENVRGQITANRKQVGEHVGGTGASSRVSGSRYVHNTSSSSRDYLSMSIRTSGNKVNPPKSTTTAKGDAFTPDYRRRIREGATPANIRSTSRTQGSEQEHDFAITFLDDRIPPTSFSMAGSQDPQHIDWMKATFDAGESALLRTPVTPSSRNNEAVESAPLSDEEIQGFDDTAVVTPRPTSARPLLVQPSSSRTKNSVRPTCCANARFI